MKKLEVQKMEEISGGSCFGMISGFAGAVSASMFGPIGIIAGAAAFAYGVRQAGSCHLIEPR